VADYPAPLPELDERLERADAAVAETPELDPGDRALLARTFRELRAEVRERTLGRRVLHGGAHDGNLLRTREGLRWIDLDTVCRGPLEWDLAHLPPAAAAAFPGADPDLLELMRALVGAEVAIWCWHTYGRAPEVDEAARIHLENVRRLGARAAG
jgi:Ser/Thr protein kinase RdoA (MazF antagonist)